MASISDQITLKTGRKISVSELTLDAGSQQFSYGPLIVTPDNSDFTFEQMALFPEFDADGYLLKLYAGHYSDTHGGAPPPPAGSTSVWSNYADNLGKTFKDIGNNLALGAGTPLRRWLNYIIIGVVIYFLVEAFMAWKAAKKAKS